MELQFGVFCLSVNFVNERIAVGGILDEVIVRDFPSALIIPNPGSLVVANPLLYVTFWRDIQEEVKPLLEVEGAGTSISFPVPPIKPLHSKALYQIVLGDLEIPEPGTYYFRLAVDGATLSKHQLDIKRVPTFAVTA
jgi:hypothetical protein